MSTFQMSHSRSSGGKSSKAKSFSSKGKIEKYNQDGTETIIVMGRPFRVLQRIGEATNHTSSSKERSSKGGKDKRSYVFLVENTENLPEFPRHLALKRSFFNVNEVLVAHREPEVLGRVKDKGIVRVFHSEVTRSDGRLGVTVAMEYCSSNLYRRLRQETRLSEGEVVQVLLAVTSVVGYLHSRQPPIAHRGISPDNILIHSGATGAAAYRLCNFSSSTTEAYECENREEVALAVEDIERHTTAAFRAPEMADPGSRKRIDERVDLWSIGVLLYYMMYLRLPFGETNMGLTGRLKVRYPAGTDTWYTGSLRVALQHLLEPDPEKRWDIFALTNFLRFDEDISRHIGTFIFTATEWPDGWEQQDVKVVNRLPPSKAPPVRLEGGRTADNDAESLSQSVTQRQAPSSSSQQQHHVELDADALAALGLDPNTSDPEMIAYHEMLIREQEEAWQQAKAAGQAGRQKATEAAPAKTKSPQQENTKADDGQKKEQQQQPQEAPEPPKPETKDIFDDLFDSTPVPAPQPAAVAPPLTASFSVPVSSYSAPPAQPAGAPNVACVDTKWQNSLFGSALPMHPSHQQQQQQQQPPNAMIMENGWGTGAPTMPPSGHGMEGMYTASQASAMMPLNPQQQHQQPMQMPQQQQQQQQVPPAWGNGPAPVPPPQQQQQPVMQQPVPLQATFDFTKGSFPLPEAPVAVQPKVEKKKDPFEDLFQ